MRRCISREAAARSGESGRSTSGTPRAGSSGRVCCWARNVPPGLTEAGAPGTTGVDLNNPPAMTLPQMLSHYSAQEAYA